MDQALTIAHMADEQDQRISDTVAREQARLRSFVRRRVADPFDAEDILQDVFAELVEACRLMQPIEQVGAWLFRVARNRITDLFRKKRPEALADQQAINAEGEAFLLEDLLPSKDAGPDEVYAQSILFDALEDALDELPAEQRDVFIAHELEGHSFKELATETGLTMSALLSRKHYAVLHLRRRLRAIYNEFSN